MFILKGKMNIYGHQSVICSCSNSSKGDQMCSRYDQHVVCKMEDICQQGSIEFCKTW